MTTPPTNPPPPNLSRDQLQAQQLLQFGAYYNRPDAIRNSIRSGANPNLVIPTEIEHQLLTETPLHTAVRCRNLDCIRLLLAEGGDGGVDNHGRTAWEYVQEGDGEVCGLWYEELCHRGGRGDIKGLERMIEQGVDIDGCEKVGGNSVLHFASSFGRVDIVKGLIFRDVRLDRRNKLGMTALMDAVKSGEKQVVGVLVDGGADTEVAVLEGRDRGKRAVDFTEDEELKRVLVRKRKDKPFKSYSSEQIGIKTKGLGGKGRKKVTVDVNNINDEQVPNSPTFNTSSAFSAHRWPEMRRNASGNVKLDAIWDHFLWPRPQKVRRSSSNFVIPRKVRIAYENDLHQDIDRLFTKLRSLLGSERIAITATDCDVYIAITPTLYSRPCSFRLYIRESGVVLQAADKDGLRHGVNLLTSLFQLEIIAQSPTSRLDQSTNVGVEVNGVSAMDLGLPGCIIEDWPLVKNRSFLIDIARRRYKLHKVIQIVNRLARLKYNCLCLNFPLNNPPNFEYFLQLKEECQKLQLDFIPCVDTSQSKLEKSKEPLLKIRSTLFALGCNTIRVNFGRDSKPPYDSTDSRIHISTLKELSRIFDRCTLLYPAGVLMQVLDTCSSSSEEESVLKMLPMQSIAIVEAGVETSRADVSKLISLGLPFYYSVSTEACNSFAGRFKQAIGSMSKIVEDMVEGKALGISVDDWAGEFCLQPAAASYVSCLVGACIGWNPMSLNEGSFSTIASLISWWWFDDMGESILGKLVCSLGEAQSSLYKILAKSTDDVQPDKSRLRMDLRRARKAIDSLRRYKGRADDDDVKDIRLMADYIHMSAEIAILTARGSEENNHVSSLSDCCNGIIHCIEEGYVEFLKRSCIVKDFELWVQPLKRLLNEMRMKKDYEESSGLGWMTLLTQ